MNDLYAEDLIENYEHPHNKGRLNDANATFHEYNPVCGDDITIYLKIEKGIIKEVKFDGDGCVISIASASLLTEAIKNRKINNVKKMDFEDLKKIIGIDPGPVRIKCATLSLKAVKEAIFLYSHKTSEKETNL
ncbi:iron-sulfur cluster assembly scaffold protein [Candidatus Marsarchaeota archaeon]|jgi:nitrogen fixation NifU-like protein|nr:iron-sulfur cluster assembly scaffold protein [Candidatus Marsarchaeota archaeon]